MCGPFTQDYIHRDNTTVNFFEDAGNPILSRAAQNSERGCEENLEDLCLSLRQEGYQPEFTPGVPVLLPNPTQAGHYVCLTHGHRIEALYLCARK